MPKQEPIWKTKGFDSEYEYLAHQAKEEGFRSLEHKYRELWAKQQGFESDAERRKSTIEKAGFETHGEYQDHLARKKGFESAYAYVGHLIKSRGFTSRIQYFDYLAKQKGFSSFAEYDRYMRREHLAKLKGFNSYAEYQEYKSKMEESIKSKRKDIKKKDACRFLQEKISENVDPESLFAKSNIEFLRKITGCKIPMIPIKEKKENK